MAGINGSIAWGITPYGTSSAYKRMMWSYRSGVVSSCNTPLIYQIVWTNGTMRELTEPSKDNYASGNGDIISMRFDVYVSTALFSGSPPSFPSQWKKIASIKKSRDLPNVSWDLSNAHTDGEGQRFTIDISSVVSNELSYSLCPIGKGTWQSIILGGMNGGKVMQDNYPLSANNPYVQDMNGAWRMLRVKAVAFIINDGGQIIESSTSKTENRIDVINSVHQWDTPLHNERLYQSMSYNTQGWGVSRGNPRTFQDTCPNLSFSTSKIPNYMKKVREDEHGEFLQWYMYHGHDYAIYKANGYDVNDTDDLCDGWALRVLTDDGNTAYLTDFVEHLHSGTVAAMSGVYIRSQRMPLVQNVSLPYIMTNAYDAISSGSSSNPITSDTTHYTIDLVSETKTAGTITSHAGYKWYAIDKERIGAMTSDRPSRWKDWTVFHWLNRGGGISSYTAKRNFSETVNAVRTTIERKTGNRIIWQDDQYDPGGTPPLNQYTQAEFLSDSMRGGNYYKGGREVLGVEAQRSQAVFTDPLNKDEAHWLEEIVTSPNVWVEVETNDFSSEEASDGVFPADGIYGKAPYRVNEFLRPTNTRYMPVIVTNSELETVNVEKGLTQMNFTYTMAHKIETQKN